MTRPVAFDTCVSTWAIQGLYPAIQLETKSPATTEEDERVKRLREDAAALVMNLDASKTPIALPSVVVAELLLIVPDTYHDAIIPLFSRGFMIHPLDYQAARIAAQLQRARIADGTYAAIKAGRAGEEGLRAKLKVDTMLVATAIRWNVDAIYSHDDDIKKIAQGRIAVLRMPPRPPEQTSFLDKAGAGDKPKKS